MMEHIIYSLQPTGTNLLTVITYTSCLAQKYNPIPIDLSDQLKWIEDEINILKSLNKSEYVINYLDSFIEIVDSEYKVYFIATTFYEVKFNFIVEK